MATTNDTELSTAAVTATVDESAERKAAEARRQVALAERAAKPEHVMSSRVHVGQRLWDVWKARELLLFMVRKDVKVRYKDSVLGIIWSMINPAMTLLVYYVVFKYFLKNDIPYFALYLFAGLLPWNLFMGAVTTASGSVVGNAGIVKKVAFPREILALSQVGTATVFFFFQAVVFVGFLVGFQITPDWAYLPLMVFALVTLEVLAAALAVFLAALNVYFRDIEHLVQVLFLVWFWALPIIYRFFPVVHGQLQRHNLLWIYFLDPLVPIIFAFQRALYGGVPISHAIGSVLPPYGYMWYIMALGIVLAVSVVLMVVATAFFGRVEGNFAEEL